MNDNKQNLKITSYIIIILAIVNIVLMGIEFSNYFKELLSLKWAQIVRQNLFNKEGSFFMDKYSSEIKLKVIKYYEEGHGFLSTA